MKKTEKIGNNGNAYRYNDLSGIKVGSYTIMYRAANAVRKSNRAICWAAKCECGNIRDLEYGNIMAAIKKFKNGTISIFSCGCKSSLPFGVSASKAAYRNYWKNAEKRGYDFNISWEDFLRITKSDCHYCGSVPKNKIGATTPTKRGNGFYVYNGMDRMNNKIGYNLDNVVPCCRKCNRAKDVMGKEDFINWIEQVYNHTRNDFDIRRYLKAV